MQPQPWLQIVEALHSVRGDGACKLMGQPEEWTIGGQ